MSVLQKLSNRLQRKPSFSYLLIFAKKLDESLTTYQARIPFDFEVLPADVDEIETSLAHIPFEHRSDIGRRVRNGDRCFIARHLGQVIFVFWIAFGKCYSYLFDREYELGLDECYGYSAYTLPEFRGKGIQPAATCQINKLLNDWGYKWTYIFVEPRNEAALRMPRKLGYEKIGSTGYIELFGIRGYFHWDRGSFTALKQRGYLQKR